MKTMKKSILGAALVAALGFGSTAQAGVIIDLFTDPAAGQSVGTSIVGNTVFSQAGPIANTIGGYRDLSIQKTFDNVGAANVGDSTLTAGGGVLQLDNATGNRSLGVVTWDGINNAGANGASVLSTGLGGINIAAGGADRFLADIIAADLGFDYKITVWDMDGSKATLSSSVQFAVQPGDGVSSDFLFNWFNLANGNYCDGVSSPPVCADPSTQLNFSILRGGNLGAINFSQIGAFQFEFTNPSTISVDFAIGTIETIPEPGSLALAGIALLGVALAGRRRKSGQA
jgi:hypothetical protein